MLLPSVFARPDVLVDQSPVPAASIRCPAPGAGLLREPDRPPRRPGRRPRGDPGGALSAALAEPLTTPALAARLGVTPSALRGAGTVSTRRSGRTALHLRTARAADPLTG
ncbi:hypothetical protein [Streptomyces goshikiensis]|uniref:hypothetical protein n=1 Tax=Streptomyces goshikiensis TaxID=1942 RepID=UPI003658731B